MFSGCALFVENSERDAKQVVAEITPITSTREIGGNEVVFKSKTEKIYKSQLFNYLNNNYDNLVNQQGMSLKDATEYVLDYLITERLIYIEAERLLFFGDIKWGIEQENEYNQYIYSAIDSQLNSLYAEILDEYDEEFPQTVAPQQSQTTYPTRDEKAETDTRPYLRDQNGNVVYERENCEYKRDANGEFVLDDLGNVVYQAIEGQTAGDYKLNDESERIPVINLWKPDDADIPAKYGTIDQISLQSEALVRLVQILKNAVKNDFTATSDDKKKFASDDVIFNDIIAGKNGSAKYELYNAIANSHYAKYVIGETARNNAMLTLLQNYIVGNVVVSEEEVYEAFNSEVNAQQTSFDADVATYESAMSAGSGKTVVYHPNNDYFYVKHVLVKFSNQQLADYEAFKAKPENAYADEIAYRDAMAPSTQFQAHPFGELTGDLLNVVDVFNSIKVQMQSVKGNVKSADKLFDDFIYLYNQDDGAFTATLGYSVKRDDVNNSGYMKEFYDGAMELYNNYEVGDLLDNYVVTDYGVHFMYYAGKAKKGVVSINDTMGYSTETTYYDNFYEKVRSVKEEEVFTRWQNERISYYQNKADVIKKNVKAYKDIYTQK